MFRGKLSGLPNPNSNQGFSSGVAKRSGITGCMPYPLPDKPSTRLMMYRINRGVLRIDICNACNITIDQLVSYEKGESSLPSIVLDQIQDILNMTRKMRENFINNKPIIEVPSKVDGGYL